MLSVDRARGLGAGVGCSLCTVLQLTVLTFTGEKAAAEDSLRQVSHLIKSTASMAPMANQVALSAHKEVELSLTMTAQPHSPQRQRIILKHKAGQVGDCFTHCLLNPLGWQRSQQPVLWWHTCC